MVRIAGVVEKPKQPVTLSFGVIAAFRPAVIEGLICSHNYWPQHLYATRPDM